MSRRLVRVYNVDDDRIRGLCMDKQARRTFLFSRIEECSVVPREPVAPPVGSVFDELIPDAR